MSALNSRALSIGMILLAGCAAPLAQPAEPAVLINVDDAARATLAHAVNQAVSGRTVLLAPDALTNSSQLLLDPAAVRDADGHLLQGRETRVPESFQLFKRSRDCVLVHERSRREYVLDGVKCEVVRSGG